MQLCLYDLSLIRFTNTKDCWLQLAQGFKVLNRYLTGNRRVGSQTNGNYQFQCSGQQKPLPAPPQKCSSRRRECHMMRVHEESGGGGGKAKWLRWRERFRDRVRKCTFTEERASSSRRTSRISRVMCTSFAKWNSLPFLPFPLQNTHRTFYAINNVIPVVALWNK